MRTPSPKTIAAAEIKSSNHQIIKPSNHQTIKSNQLASPLYLQRVEVHGLLSLGRVAAPAGSRRAERLRRRGAWGGRPCSCARRGTLAEVGVRKCGGNR